MASHQDILLGRVALDLGVLTREQIEQAVALQEGPGAGRPFGSLLLEKGFLSEASLQRVLAEQAKRLKEKAEFSALRKADTLFGTIAIEKKLLTRENLHEALRVQAVALMHGNKVRLGEVLEERGVLTREQVAQILQLQARRDDEVNLPGYEILSKLGQGGMGAVYRARQVSMDRVVAVKVLSPKLCKDKSFVQRFLTEARNSAKLNHPNVIRGIDVLQHGSHFYYIMEYVEGESLRGILESGPLSEDKAIDVALQIAGALQHAEERRLVHRDIKPDNILINEEDVAKLCDLGLSKHAENRAALTDAGTVIGTPDYMSPEQARGEKDLDIRTDLYSLGVTLYHMLTGGVPFRAKNPIEVLRMHLKVAPTNPKEQIGDLSDEVCGIVMRLLAKKPEDRYGTAAELVKVLKDLKTGRDRARLLAQAPDAARRPRTGAVPAAKPAGVRRSGGFVPARKPDPMEHDTDEGVEEDLDEAEDGARRAAAAAKLRDHALLAGGAAVLLLGIVVLVWGFRGAGTRDLANAPENLPANLPANLPEDPGSGLAAAEAEYQALVRYAGDNPGQLRESMAKLKSFAEAHKADRLGSLAGLKHLELQRRWDESAEEALRAAVARARELAGERRFREAQDAIAAVERDWPDSTAAAKVGAAVTGAQSEARKYFAAERDTAEKLVRERDYPSALEIYRRLETVGLEDLAEAARARIGEIRILVEKKDEEDAAAARAALWGEFEGEAAEIFRLLAARDFSKVSSRYFACLANTKYREIWPEIEAHKKRIEPYFGFWKDFEAGARALVGRERVLALADGRSAKGKVVEANLEMLSLRDGSAVFGIKVRDLAPRDVVDIVFLALDKGNAEAHVKCAVFYAVSGDADSARSELEAARALGMDVAPFLRTLRLDKPGGG